MDDDVLLTIFDTVVEILETKPPYKLFVDHDDWDLGLNSLQILDKIDAINPPGWPGAMLACNIDVLKAVAFIANHIRTYGLQDD